MKAVVDSLGRIVVPKPLRDALGLHPGSTVEISHYGAGLQLLPVGRTAWTSPGRCGSHRQGRQLGFAAVRRQAQ